MNRVLRVLVFVLLAVTAAELFYLKFIDLVYRQPQQQSEIEENGPILSITNTTNATATATAIAIADNVTQSITRTMKTILVWNAYYRVEVGVFGYGHEPFVRNQCPVSDCLMTTNRSHVPLDQFDAILFNVPLLFNVSQKFPERGQRRPEQRYIFFTQESPAYNVEDLRRHDSVFNWTMSYQRFSDIPLLYGRYEPLGERPAAAAIDWQLTANKSKLVAWFASHCDTQSLRERYIRKLKQHVDVDVYGLCGPLKCGFVWETGLSRPECYQIMERDYKFYLSFENSLCVDYATEKLFRIFDYHVVPIVLGHADYSQITPPHSYINALDYTPQELAAYLTVLDNNDTLYNEYFAWKKSYVVYSGLEAMTRESFCLLCHKLHHDRQVKVYGNIHDSWSAQAQCRSPSAPIV